MPEPGRPRPPAADDGAGRRRARARRPVLARAHHGSVVQGAAGADRGRRSRPGRLPAVVATSQPGARHRHGRGRPRRPGRVAAVVASGLQRVGRAGHQVGAVSRGRDVPQVPRRPGRRPPSWSSGCATGAIEELRVPAQPARRAGPADRRDGRDGAWHGRRAATRWSAGPRRSPTLPRPALEAVLDMLSGRYPREEFAELRPRLVWDRVTGTLTGRPGAQRLAVTSGGTIPDRGLFGVFLAGGERRDGPGAGSASSTRRWSTSRGSATCSPSARRRWRIEDITHDQVLVTPAPGQPGQLPFWQGDALGRPAELGRAVGAFVREVAALPDEARHASGPARPAWTSGRGDNLRRLPARAARGHPARARRPDPGGRAVPRRAGRLAGRRALAVRRARCTRRGRWRSRRGCASATASTSQAMHADDGIVLRLPDVETEDGRRPTSPSSCCSTRRRRGRGHRRGRRLGALRGPVPRVRRPGTAAAAARRPASAQPLWQQRQRAAQLLQVAAGYRSSRSSSRPCASACRTCSTCRASWR